MPKESALWRVNQTSAIGHSLIAEGTENVVYNPPEGGEVYENLSPMNETAQAIVDAQKSPHPDKTVAKPEAAAPVAPKARGPKAKAADAAPAEAPPAGGEGAGGAGEGNADEDVA